MNSTYGMMLVLLRSYLRRKRDFTRRLPDGLTDLISSFTAFTKHFNFLKLIPTCIAVMMVPEHVFRRFHTVAKGKSLMISSPAQSLLQLATLIGSVHYLGNLYLNEHVILALLVIASLTCPFWSYPMFVFIKICRLWRNSQVFFAIFQKMDFVWIDHALDVALSFRHLRRLRWSQYFQSIILFTAYSFFAIPCALIVPIALGIVAVKLNSMTAQPWQSDYGTSPVLRYFWRADVFLLAVELAWLILRPMTFLLLYCSTVPHQSALRFESYTVLRLFNKLYFDGRSAADFRLLSDKSASNEGKERVLKALGVLLARWRLAESDLIRGFPEQLADLLANRKEMADEMLPYRIYIDPDKNNRLMLDLQRLEEGKPLGAGVSRHDY